MKPKKCKGTGKAKGYGCQTESVWRKYGLCRSCYAKWLYTTDEGRELIERSRIKAKKKVETEKKREWTKRKRELNSGKTMKLADTYFSRYIRLKYSKDGKCTCYTCGALKDITDIDNGHFQKREHQATRYHEDNCRPQCKTCNGDVKHNGKQIEFRENLVREIGEDNVQEIERLSRSVYKTNYKHFKDLADHYREQLNQLQKKLNIKIW